MIVWGGRIPGVDDLPAAFPETGGRYAPSSDAWSPVTPAGSPSGRTDLAAIWSGAELIVWGGANGSLVEVGSGGRFCACAGGIFYRDADADGLGDAADFVEACSAPPGYTTDAGDCDDGDGAVWATPGVVSNLRFSDAVTLAWDAPDDPGGTALAFDVIRSVDPADFVTAAACVATDEASTEALDADAPSPGETFHYLARAQNDCPLGQGPLGQTSSGAPREGRTCP
jgi:hypothetical protein